MRGSAAVIGALVVLGSPSLALAKQPPNTIAPPGNSGVSQYVEQVPTASGGQPSNTVHSKAAAGATGGNHGSGPPAAGGSSGSGSSTPTISRSTERALHALGSSGKAAAGLAAATAPTPVHEPSSSGPANHGRQSRTHRHHRRHGGSHVAPKPHLVATPTPQSSPTGALLKTLAGSSSGGGLGILLPVLLVLSVVAAAAVALLRRRPTA